MTREKSGIREVAEAAEWRLIGLLLQRPHPGWHEEVAAIGGEVADARLCAAAQAAGDADEGSYLGLLGPGGITSPRTVGHLPFAEPGQVLSALAAHHDAFGFRPRAEDPIDHVAVLCDFVAYLLVKEGYARVRGERDEVGVAAAARHHVLETYLAPIASPLAERLGSVASGYLVDAAFLLRGRVPPAPPRLLGPGEEVLEEGCPSCPSE